MAKLLVTFDQPTRSPTGDLYYGRVMGRVADDGLWEGWVEFTLAGDETTIESPRETEQSTWDELNYWAQGLSSTYLEGALVRALQPAEARAKSARADGDLPQRL